MPSVYPLWHPHTVSTSITTASTMTSLTMMMTSLLPSWMTIRMTLPPRMPCCLQRLGDVSPKSVRASLLTHGSHRKENCFANALSWRPKFDCWGLPGANWRAIAMQSAFPPLAVYCDYHFLQSCLSVPQGSEPANSKASQMLSFLPRLPPPSS